MSYILDALRRSQAERERGQVPGLDAQPVAGSPALAARRPHQALWIGLIAGLALGLLAAVLAWMGAREPTPAALAQGSTGGSGASPAASDGSHVVSTAPSGVREPGAGGASTPTARDGTTVLPAPGPIPAPFPIVVSAPPSPPPQRADAPLAAPSPAVQSERVAAQPLAAAPAAPAPAPASAARAAPATAAEPEAVPVAQLPAAQRRELPALAVGGVIWSENPASRFVIVDGQVVREGGTVAPGLTLLRIERNAAILSWRGGRLRLPL